MMPSNVSGGFWLQNHQTVTGMMGRESVGVGVDIELECLEASEDAEGYKHAVNAKHTRWAVRYLARKPSGSGMSGGWIYFAIDHVSHTFHTTTCKLAWCSATAWCADSKNSSVLNTPGL